MRPPDPLPTRRSTLALCALLLTLPACATDTLTLARPRVQMTVIDRDSGQPLNVYRKDGRSWVAGQPATRYAIRLSNPGSQRVLVVLSVDGVNVVSGETAAYGQTGYVLEPGRTHDITGWRKSDTAVAVFEFAAGADSYAAQTGRPGNVGVIGAAVFLEKPLPPPLPPPPLPPTAPPVADAVGKASAAPAALPPTAADRLGSGVRMALAPAMPAAPALQSRAERLGTAHGEREWSVSQRTRFERLSTQPQQLIELAYDSRANLLAAGIIPAPERPAGPRPFPDEVARGYVPDPPR